MRMLIHQTRLPVGRVDTGMTGFNYVYSMDMATIQLGYSPKTTTGNNDDGSNSGAGGLKSSHQ